MNKVIGTCSICRGQVVIPEIWGGINPPTPTCANCKAVAVGHGPVIPMARPGSCREHSTAKGLDEQIFGVNLV